MKTDDILDAARKRLAAIPAERSALDAEEQRLKRMLAAADGQPEIPKVAPLPEPVQPLPVPWPFVIPQSPVPMPYQPVTPWWARSDHGGACACPQCCPIISGCITVSAQRDPMAQVLFVGDIEPAWDLAQRNNGVRIDPTLWWATPPAR